MPMTLLPLVVFLTQAAPATTSPDVSDIGVCAAVVASIDPDGDGISTGNGSPEARAAAARCRDAGDPLGAVSVAYTLLNAGQRDAARAALSNVPESAEAERVRCLIDTDEKLPSALVHCDRAIALRPTWARAYSSRANALLSLGRKDDALKAADSAVGIAPRDPSLQSNRARVLEALGRNQDAAAGYARASELAPRALELLNRLARMQLALGRKQDAAATLERSLAIAPNDYALNERGKLRRDARQFVLAAADFAQAEELNPTWAEPWLEAAYADQDQRDYVSAIAKLDKAATLDPKWAAPVFARGFSKEKLNRRVEAEADYRLAMQLAPKWSSPLVALSGLASDAGDHAKARALAGQAIAINPDDGAAYNNFAFASYNLGDKQVALANYNRSLAIDPTFQPSLFWRARTYTDLNNGQAAIADYSKLVEVNPNYGWAWANRAWLRALGNDFNGSVADLSRAGPLLNTQASFWDIAWPIYVARVWLAPPGQGRALADQGIAAMASYWPKSEVAGAYHARGAAFLAGYDDPQRALIDLRRAAALDPTSKRYAASVRQAEEYGMWKARCGKVTPIIGYPHLDIITAAQAACFPDAYEDVKRYWAGGGVGE